MSDVLGGTGAATELIQHLTTAERKIEELVNLATVAIDAIGASDYVSSNEEMKTQLRQDLHDILHGHVD